MANHFIAVGGTGQVVAYAYLKLTALCGVEPAGIYVVDADVNSPIADNLRAFSTQNETKWIKPVPAACAAATTLKELFTVTNNADINNVLSVLFTQQSLRIPVDKGMFMNPSVGAAVLMTTANTPKPPRVPEFYLQDLANQINANDVVLICGSVIGGTGAGGVSTLAQYIRNQRRNDVKIVIIDFLKWFNIKGNVPENETLKQNSESGVFYLKDKIASNVDACVLLGTEEQHQLPVAPEAVGAQNEKIHPLSLLAAAIANNSFNYGSNRLTELFPQPNRIYNYIIPDGGLTAEGLEIRINANETVTMDKIIRMVSAIIKFLGYFNNYINGGPPSFSFTPWLVQPANLRKILKSITVEALSEAVGTKKVGYFKSLLNWYDKLVDFKKDSNLFNFEKSSDINIKTVPPIMPFLRKWFKNVKIPMDVKVDGVVKEMIKALRESIEQKKIV